MPVKKNIGPKGRWIRFIFGVLWAVGAYFALQYGQQGLFLISMSMAVVGVFQSACGYCFVHGARGTKDMS